MRISPVINYQYGVRTNSVNKNNVNFTGSSQTKIVNVGTEENVRDTFKPSDFHISGRQRFIKGSVPVEVVSGSYPPDLMIKGTVYCADWGEWVGDWAKETHSAVIADTERTKLTMDRVMDTENDSPDEMRSMQNCLRSDIRHQRIKLSQMEEGAEGRKAIEDRIAELEAMEKASEKNYADKMEDLRLHNYDYYAEKAKRNGYY